MLNLSHTECACYVAGFFDGEGHFGITAGSRQRMYPILTITNTHLGVILLIKEALERWGVTVGRVTDFLGKPDSNHKDAFRIQISSKADNVNTFLSIILPYLIVKSEQAKLIMRFCELRVAEGKQGTDSEDEEYLIYLHVKMWNRQGK